MKKTRTIKLIGISVDDPGCKYFAQCNYEYKNHLKWHELKEKINKLKS